LATPWRGLGVRPGWVGHRGLEHNVLLPPAGLETVSRWAKEGKLPFMKTLGGHRRYPEAQIRELLNELRQEPTA
jgi:excisionase family DNA binding protein